MSLLSVYIYLWMRTARGFYRVYVEWKIVHKRISVTSPVPILPP